MSSQLYYSIASLRLVNDPIAIQFVASKPSEGTSLVASQFAAFSAGIEAGSALLIDCVTPPQWRNEQRPTLAEVFSAKGQIEPAIASHELVRNLYGATLSNHPNSILHTDPVALGAVLDQARQRYRMTVLDTPSLEESPGTLVFSRACDAVVLVLEAEKTPAEVAEATIDAIERGGGKVIGLIFNKRRFHMPRWLYRRL